MKREHEVNRFRRNGSILKIITVILVISLALAGTAAADGELVASGSTSKGNLIYFNVYRHGETRLVRLSGTGAIPDFEYHNSYCHPDADKEYCPWMKDSYAKYAMYYEVEEGITALGMYSFDNLDNLHWLTLPASLKLIPQKAIVDCRHLYSLKILSRDAVFAEGLTISAPDLEIVCYLNSTAHRYAKEHGIAFDCMDCDHSDTGWEIVREAENCQVRGTRKKICNVCGKNLGTESYIGDHDWGDWVTLHAATISAAEVRERVCSVCGAAEQETAGEPLTPVLELEQTSYILKPNESAQLNITRIANGDSVAAISSSQPKVATASVETLVIQAGSKTGKAILTVRLVSGLEETVTVTVEAQEVRTRKITGIPKKLTLKKGKSKTLKPKLVPDNSTEKITYTSSDPSILTVTKNGKIRAVSRGKATITIKSGKAKVKCRITVK